MDEIRQASRPATVLAGPYGHPLHPMLVTVPIGAWTASLVFDVASHIVDDPAFLVQGSVWLIALGVLGALAAATVGFLDLFAIPVGTRPHRIAVIHMSLNMAVVLAYGVNWGLRAGQDSSSAVSVWLVVMSAVTFAALGVSGFLGGELAYRHGVRVADPEAASETPAQTE